MARTRKPVPTPQHYRVEDAETDLPLILGDVAQGITTRFATGQPASQYGSRRAAIEAVQTAGLATTPVEIVQVRA